MALSLQKGPCYVKPMLRFYALLLSLGVLARFAGVVDKLLHPPPPPPPTPPSTSPTVWLSCGEVTQALVAVGRVDRSHRLEPSGRYANDHVKVSGRCGNDHVKVRDRDSNDNGRTGGPRLKYWYRKRRTEEPQNADNRRAGGQRKLGQRKTDLEVGKKIKATEKMEGEKVMATEEVDDGNCNGNRRGGGWKYKGDGGGRGRKSNGNGRVDDGKCNGNRTGGMRKSNAKERGVGGGGGGILPTEEVDDGKSNGNERGG